MLMQQSWFMLTKLTLLKVYLLESVSGIDVKEGEAKAECMFLLNCDYNILCK